MVEDNYITLTECFNSSLFLNYKSQKFKIIYHLSNCKNYSKKITSVKIYTIESEHWNLHNPGLWGVALIYIYYIYIPALKRHIRQSLRTEKLNILTDHQVWGSSQSLGSKSMEHLVFMISIYYPIIYFLLKNIA